ncbi:hypothetical protein ACHQM5_015396 [Ranunculus cassubicifolius]
MSFSIGSQVFNVERKQPELIRPAKPTPYEIKDLSDLDDQEGLRFQLPGLLLFQKNELMEGKDPVEVIREAIAKTLVYYYPLAGRSREGPNRKLRVECTGEGVMFVEAVADIRLEQFGDSLHPPFPGIEELLYDVPGSSGVTDCPLLLIQLTRLNCGGFIFALRLNHTIIDAAGLAQFMQAIGEIARGASTPSVEPIWNRELLYARDPPQVTCVHHKCDQMPPPEGTPMIHEEMADRSFFFGPREAAALKKRLPSNISTSTTFDVVTACIWRSRTIALDLIPNEEMRLLCPMNGRGKLKLPAGYYGNAFVFSIAVATAGEICENPFEYTVELVKKAKAEVTEEYIRSFVDLMVVNGRPHVAAVQGTYLISDNTRSGFGEVDFGWGKPIYGGPALVDVGSVPGVGCFYLYKTNDKGEKGMVVPVRLPARAMDRFVMELDSMIGSVL